MAALSTKNGDRSTSWYTLNLAEDIQPMAFIDQTNRLEKLDALTSVTDWLDLCQPRNMLAHEYGDDTPIGDRGIRLSGGQRQRVGIARADPPVLLMDEATSALDSETEAALNAAIDALAGNKTVIVIANREATLQGCRHVVDIDHGRVKTEVQVRFRHNPLRMRENRL